MNKAGRWKGRQKGKKKTKNRIPDAPGRKGLQLAAEPPFPPPHSHFHLGQKIAPSAATLQPINCVMGRNWVSSGIAGGAAPGGRPLAPWVCGGDPSQCARQPSHPRRACTPPRSSSTEPPAAELPKRPGGSSPGTLPLWGASFSPPPVLTPAVPHTPATLGQFSATCSGAGKPGRRQPVSRCACPEPHGAAGRQQQLRERCVGPAGTGGDPVHPALCLPFAQLLSSVSSPARGPQTGQGVLTGPPT